MDWHILYRLYDDAGHLLYVGITRASVRDRISAHRRKPWGDQIACHTEQRIAGREVALRIEATAICDELPAHNIYQTENATVRGQRSKYGRCPRCESVRPLRPSGTLKQHWSVGMCCQGSGEPPEPLGKRSATLTKDSPGKGREGKGREGNREGKTPLDSSSSSIVTAVSASGSRRWMPADAARFGGR